MIRVLGLALYGPLAPSHRYRLGQYVAGLARYGIELRLQSLLGDTYLRRRFDGGSVPVRDLAAAGWERLGLLLRRRDFDLVIVHKELFPVLPGWFEQALLRQPYIFDYDDAVYLKYRTGRLGMLRLLLGGKFDRLMRGAAAVTAGNATLLDYAGRHNRNSVCLPTVVDTERYLLLPRASVSVFRVGWIGSPTTATYLAELVEPLARIAREGPVRLVLVGGTGPSIPGVEVVELPWSEEAEVELINGFDVGVMPLPDDPWARGKCAFKLIQYMACGVPVIGSRVGANQEVVTRACGFLADTADEWAAALRMLRDRPVMRREMGAAGRARIEAHYSLARNLPRLAEVIERVCRSR